MSHRFGCSWWDRPHHTKTLHWLQLQLVRFVVASQLVTLSSVSLSVQFNKAGTFETVWQAKYYNYYKREHCQFGNKFSSIEYECKPNETRTLMWINKEAFNWVRRAGAGLCLNICITPLACSQSRVPNQWGSAICVVSWNVLEKQLFAMLVFQGFTLLHTPAKGAVEKLVQRVNCTQRVHT